MLSFQEMVALLKRGRSLRFESWANIYCIRYIEHFKAPGVKEIYLFEGKKALRRFYFDAIYLFEGQWHLYED